MQNGSKRITVAQGSLKAYASVVKANRETLRNSATPATPDS